MKTQNLSLLFSIFIAGPLFSQIQLTPVKDSLFFAQKKSLLTAVWKSPFSYGQVITQTTPAGPYMGNGDVGVAATTTSNGQTLRISKVDFVTDNVQYFNWLAAAPSALPVGGVQINVTSASASGFNYEMDMLGNELRMTTATSVPVKMKSWMAVDDNVIVTEITTSSATPVSMTIETFADNANAWYATTSSINGQVAQVSRQTKTVSTKWLSKAGISTKIIGATPVLTLVSSSRVRTSFTVSNAQTVYALTYVSGGGKTNDAKLPAAYTRLNSFTTDSVARVLNTKNAWWKDMWCRSYVETNDPLLNRHYLSSIYQLASACNKHSPVCGGMYGVWNMNDSMMYNGDIHLNYNSQAGFYSVFSANRPEIALPFFNFLDAATPDGKLRAKNQMGNLQSSWSGKSCRGILFPVSGFGAGDLFGSYWQQTMDAPFNVSLYSWYYEYTGDLNFLRDRAYPFIKNCGDFYEDFIKKENYGSSYRYTITCGIHEDSWDLNDPADVALMQQTFGLLIKYSKILNVDANRRALWQDILSHAPKYPVIQHNGKPVFAKNEAGWDYPNHMVNMHPVYPCEVLTFLSNPDTVNIAKNTIDYFCVEKDAFGSLMNALGLSSFIMAARIGYNPDVIIKYMKGLITSAKPNFVIQDGHCGLEKTTPIEVINSMMLQSIDSTLYLFPNWIKQPAVFTRLRSKGAFLVSAEYGNPAISNVSIYSEKGTPCHFKNPWTGKILAVKETFNGNTAAIPASVNKDIYSFHTKAGGTYTFDILSNIPESNGKELNYTVFPNPANSFLTIQLNEINQTQNTPFTVFDLVGKKRMSAQITKGQSQISLDVSGLDDGIYFISVGGSAKKIIINR